MEQGDTLAAEAKVAQLCTHLLHGNNIITEGILVVWNKWSKVVLAAEAKAAHLCTDLPQSNNIATKGAWHAFDAGQLHCQVGHTYHGTSGARWCWSPWLERPNIVFICTAEQECCEPECLFIQIASALATSGVMWRWLLSYQLKQPSMARIYCGAEPF
eukprot:1146717-Pelagomonas_calceolata.AAC.4